MSQQTALLVVDIQNDYFPDFAGAKLPLEQQPKAAQKAAEVISAYRAQGLPVVFIQHQSPDHNAPLLVEGSEGALINELVAPRANEEVVQKQFANSFKGTRLKAVLDQLAVKQLTILGSMCNICIDATTRAAADLGYACTVVTDACAAMPASFENVAVSAEQTKAAFLSALAMGRYAALVASGELTAKERV